MDANKLPPLPMLSEEWEMARGQTYTTRHMKDYALAAIAAAGAPDLRSAPTDISAQLREYAGNPGYSHNDYADVMRQAADECERFYGGMLAWKENAKRKDVQMAEYRAALASAAPVEALTNAVKDMLIDGYTTIGAHRPVLEKALAALQAGPAQGSIDTDAFRKVLDQSYRDWVGGKFPHELISHIDAHIAQRAASGDAQRVVDGANLRARALRQYRHNNSDEFVFAYDKATIDAMYLPDAVGAAPIGRISHAEEGFADIELLGDVKVGDYVFAAAAPVGHAEPVARNYCHTCDMDVISNCGASDCHVASIAVPVAAEPAAKSK